MSCDKMASDRFYFLFLLFAFSCSFGAAQNHVPVLMWSSNSQLKEDSTLLSGRTIPFSRLRDSYLTTILQSDPQNICIFLRNELSLDDFTVYGDAFSADSTGGIFKNTKRALEKSRTSVVLESVDLPQTGGGGGNAVVDYLARGVDGSVLHLDLGSSSSSSSSQQLAAISQLQQPATQTNLIVFKLPVSQTTTSQESLQEADGIVGKVMEQLSGLKSPYTTILTAHSPSKVVENAALDDLEGEGRRLLSLQATTAPPLNATATFFNISDCLYLYAQELHLLLNYGDKLKETTEILFPTDSLEVDQAASYCSTSNLTSLLVASISSALEGLTKFEMRMMFSNSSQSIASALWTVTNLSVSYDYSGDKGTASGENQQLFVAIYAAFNQSYKCSNQSSTLVPTKEVPKATANIRFTNFQVEPFLAIANFSESADCVGLFSEGAWMSLATSLILGLILVLGLLMIINLEAMDKFDDPKAKTITITAAAD